MTEYVVKIGFWLRAYDSVTVEADADAEAIRKPGGGIPVTYGQETAHLGPAHTLFT